MRKFALIKVFVFSAILIFVSCEDEKEKKGILQSKFVEGLTINNYPRMDGSTSTLPLNTIIFCELLGIEYKWKRVTLPPDFLQQWAVEPALYDNNSDSQHFWDKVKSSQTHQSFINLIDKKTDLILSARIMSPDEKEYANLKGATLIETPIALDAFIFLVNPNNPVTSLTIQQIQDIYTGKITNWKEVGGSDAKINPYVRNPNSGSQELMELLVMKDLDLLELPIAGEAISTMEGVFDMISTDVDGICFSVYYYREFILRDLRTKVTAIDGISPSKDMISNKLYPLASEVYAVIRSDVDKSSMAYKVYEFLQTEAGKEIIGKSEYLPY